MATRTISTKLAIEGESEYRSAISRINTELKTLQSSLKLTESQYQTNANSMEALKAKGEALSSLYDAQKSKVETLKSALENARGAQETYARNCEDLKAKIQANGEAMEKLKASSGDTSKEQQALAAETEKLKKELTEEEAKLAAAEKGVNSWQTQLNNAEVKLNGLDAELQKNDRYLDEAKNSADGCAKSIDQYGNEVKESAEATEKQNDALDALSAALAASGLVAGIEKIKEALQACVQASADFEAGMSAVGAIASASSEEMDLLADKAKAIGASTKFTAGEAADAMQYMALAGWSAEEMLNGVDGVIQLAAASGEDLARVSDIVTDALTAFGLKAEDSVHFVDVLAKTAASSNTTVSMLGEAFKYAAPLAGALGYSVEDVAVAMGLMANQGIKGSQAGTAMRTMFTKLAGDITLSAEAFGEVTISAANADGTMKPLSQSLEELRSYFGQMTQAEKLANAEAVAGKYAMSGLTAIMNSTEEDFQSLTATIQDCAGAAKTMADIRMDNLAGQVTLMESALDALKIAVGDDLNPALRGLAETGTDALTWAAEFVEEHKILVPLIASTTTGLVTLTGALAGFGIVKTLTPLVTAFNAALANNPVGLVIVGVTTLATALGTFHALLERESIPTVKDFTDAARNLSDSMDDIKEKTDSSVQATEATAAQASYYVKVLQELEAAGLDSAESQEAYRQTVEKLNAIMPDLNLTIDEQTGLVNGGTEAINSQIEAWKNLAVQEALQEQYKETLSLVAEVEAEQYLNRVKLNEAQADGVILSRELEEKQQRMAEIQQQMNELVETGATRTREGVSAYQDLANEHEQLARECSALNDELILNEALQGDLSTAIDMGTEAVAEQQEAIDEATEALKLFNEEQSETAEEIAETSSAEQIAAEAVSENLKELAESYKEAYESAKQSLDGQFGLWEEAVTVADKSANEIAEAQAKAWDDAYSAAEKSIQGTYGLLEQAVGFAPKQASDMIAALESQTQYWEYYQEIIHKVLNSGIEGVDAFVQQFLDGSNESVAALSGFANATDEQKEQIIANFQAVQAAEKATAEDIANLRTQGSEDMAALAESSQLSVEQILEAQKSQQAYWKEYSDNLNNLLSRNVEGVEALTKAYGDGSAESAQALAVLASATDEELTEIINSMGRTDELRSSIAETGAKLETDFNAKLTAMVDDYAGMVTALKEKSGEVDFGPFNDAVVAAFSEIGAKFGTIGTDAGTGLKTGIETSTGDVITAADAMGQGIIDALRTVLDSHSPSNVTDSIGQDSGEGLAQGLEKSAERVGGASETLGQEVITHLTEAAREAVDGYDAEIRIIEERTREHLEAARKAISEYDAIFSSEMMGLGSSMIDGMAQGIYARSGYLYSAMESVVRESIEAARQAADVHSPSKKTEKIFEDVGEGMVVGVEKKKARVAEATQGVVDKALSVDTSGMIEVAKMLGAQTPDLSPLLSQAFSGSGGRSGSNVTVQVDMTGAVVREEADIEKISSGLAQKIAFALRQKGWI